ncbi:hypothetical protein V2J09_020857 [Rumex salicifolius]
MVNKENIKVGTHEAQKAVKQDRKVGRGSISRILTRTSKDTVLSQPRNTKLTLQTNKPQTLRIREKGEPKSNSSSTRPKHPGENEERYDGDMEVDLSGQNTEDGVGAEGDTGMVDRIQETIEDIHDNTNDVQDETAYMVVTLKASRSGEAMWLLSVIYASPNPSSREELWRRLLDFSGSNATPWLLMGDFNETRLLSERTGDSDNMRRRCEKFNNWIDEMCLVDIGFSGPKYTWSRGREHSTRICARLDRGLCNIEWHTLFEDGAIQHLPANQSDHSPLLMSIRSFEDYRPREQSFKFQVAWLLHHEFQTFLAQNWRHGVELPQALSNLALQLGEWNKEVFGNLFRNRDRLWRRIEGAQKDLNENPTEGLLHLERRLRRKLDTVLEQIHLFWIQKARSELLLDGDINTRFFHACSVMRRKRNKVEGMYNNADAWISDPQELNLMPMAFDSSSAIGSTTVLGAASADSTSMNQSFSFPGLAIRLDRKNYSLWPSTLHSALEAYALDTFLTDVDPPPATVDIPAVRPTDPVNPTTGVLGQERIASFSYGSVVRSGNVCSR